MNAADTAWMLISTALVILMTPALGLFYGGLVRDKNVLSTIMHSFFALALISVQWVLFGYSLAFAPDAYGGFIGGLDYVGLQGVGVEPGPYAATIPHLSFMMFQLTFAAITPALISGAFAERKNFSAFVLFTLLWATLVYDPVCHWVWGKGGFIASMGALDFAGGTVVHISSGVSALVVALVVGRRTDYGHGEIEPHNATLTLLGTGLLWFGSFGFNAGSALAANGTAVVAMVNTNTAAGAGALAWVLTAYARRGRVTNLGAAVGAVAGLVGITPAAGFVTPLAAIVIGGATGALCFFGVELTSRARIDDSLDVFGVHGVGGTIGALLTGVFATSAITGAAEPVGLVDGNAGQLGVQLISVLVVAAYAAVSTWGILKVVAWITPLRVPEHIEARGLDVGQHGESGYNLAPAE
jgi:Amt family ammonium transporter